MNILKRIRIRNYSSTINVNNVSKSNNEVEKFSKIGKEWWDKGSTKGTGPLHAMNPTRGTLSLLSLS